MDESVSLDYYNIYHFENDKYGKQINQICDKLLKEKMHFFEEVKSVLTNNCLDQRTLTIINY